MIEVSLEHGTKQLELFEEDPAAVLNVLHRIEPMKGIKVEVFFLEAPESEADELLAQDGVLHTAEV